MLFLRFTTVVEIAEPMTMLTDYLITIVTFVFAVMIFNNESITSNPGSIMIGFTLVMTGLGSLFGGSAHGFKPAISENSHRILWTLTTYSIGVASFFFQYASITSSFESQLVRTILILLVSVQLVVYLVWMWSHTEFLYVIINYGAAMIMIVGFKIYSLLKFGDPSSVWILGGIGISVIASVIQALEISPHDKYFNHNDLFHIVQLPGFYLLYRGALLLPVMT